MFKGRPLVPKAQLQFDQSKLRPLIYGFTCKLMVEGQFIDVTLFQDPHCYFEFNIFRLDTLEPYTRIHYYMLRNLERENAVNVLSEKRFRDSDAKELTESVELELHSGELLLFFIQDELIREKFVESIYYIMNACVVNPFCRYSMDAMISTILGTGLFLGGHVEKIDKARLSLFFNLAKVHVTKKTLKNLLDMHVLDETNITMEEVRTICLLILKKPEFRGVFLEYAGRYGGKELVEVMDYSEFKAFYREKNKETIEREFYNEMISQLKNPQIFFQMPISEKSKMISFIEFTNILFSDWNLAIDPMKELVGYQDMTHPATAYFINTSHNTYLTGNQVGGSVDCRAYYEALQLGCRCIEIDCYDGKNDEPVITYDKGGASVIILRDALICISKWAFKYAETPLIISFENHCSIPQRQKIRQMLDEYFGDALYYISEKEFKQNYAPSPEKLERRILIKSTSNYRHKKFMDKDKKFEKHRNQLIEEIAKKEETKPEVKKDGAWLRQQKKLIMADVTFMFSERFNVCNLITPFGVCSLTETKFQKMIDQYGRERMVEHHHNYFSRVYPKAERVNSTNFNPLMGWGAGAQMIAMNFQNKDNSMLINFGLFRKNGGKKSGWVLRPRVLIDNKREEEFDTRFKMRIISGQNLGALLPENKLISECYVYVDVEMIDLIEGDEKERKHWRHITSVTQYNLYHPQWKDMDFIMTAKRNETTFLLFKVIEAKEGTILGRTAIPCDAIRPGYRTIELHDEDMDDIPNARLMAFIQIDHIFPKKDLTKMKKKVN